MQVQSMTLEYEERVSQAWPIPYRLVTAALEMLPVVAAGAQPLEPEKLQLFVEAKRVQDGEFEVVATSREVSSGERTVVEIPRNEGSPEYGKYDGVFRLRLVHFGRFMPHFRLQLQGL